MVVLAAAWFVAISNVSFWRGFLAGREVNGSNLVLVVATAIVIFGVNFLLLIPFSFRRVLKPVLTIHLLGASAASWFIDHFHVYIDMSMIRNVVQTDAREAGELVTWGMAGWVLATGVAPSILVWLARFPSGDTIRAWKRRMLMSVVVIVAMSVSLFAFFSEYASYFRNDHSARYLITPMNYTSSLIRVALESQEGRTGERIVIGQDARLGAAWQDGSRPVVFVLVVGETARAASFSLNGYERETNPRLRNEDIINFPSVYACGTATADALPCMFSRFDRDNYSDARGRGYESLLDVLRHAGLPVIWLENNSGCKGACNGVESENLAEAEIPGLCSDGECFDEALLLRTRELLEGLQGNLVLVHHQKGSHGPAYYRRYPEAFQRFRPECASQDFGDCTTEQIRNSYDNSILYTDHVLTELIDMLDSESARFDTAMLYVSDHGESVGEGGLFLHGLPYSIAPDVQKKVPMIVWLSDGFASRFDLSRDEVRARSHETISHDHLFHSVLGLLDVETTERDPSLDLFAPRRPVRAAAGN